jgi:hypothetical protein
MGLSAGDSKEEPLRRVLQVLAETSTAYALIGGIAIQLYNEDPRTTLDIDIAVPTFGDIPAQALIAAGFEHETRYPHSDNWRAPGVGPRPQRVAVTFSAEDVGIAAAVANAHLHHIDGQALRVARPADLVVLKLAAAEEPTRRLRKRRQDLLDILMLVEDFAEAASAVADLSARLRALQTELMRIAE